jgi:hypothetical protein
MDAKGVQNMYSILVVLINTILPELHLVGLLYIIRQENSCIKYLSSIPSSHQLQEDWVRLSSNSSTGEMLLLVPFFKNMPVLIN